MLKICVSGCFAAGLSSICVECLTKHDIVIGCVKHQIMSGSNIGDDHKEYLAVNFVLIELFTRVKDV